MKMMPIITEPARAVSRFDSETMPRECVYEVVRVCAGLGAVPGRAVEEAPDGLHGLQEGRHAEVV
jgi:hypothetical protein